MEKSKKQQYQEIRSKYLPHNKSKIIATYYYSESLSINWCICHFANEVLGTNFQQYQADEKAKELFDNCSYAQLWEYENKSQTDITFLFAIGNKVCKIIPA